GGPTKRVRLGRTTRGARNATVAADDANRDSPLLARLVASRGVAFELLRVEVHLAQVAARVAGRLVVEVRRVGVAALAARGDRHRVYLVAELDDRDEAVAAGAVHPLGARVGPRAERRERAPLRAGE